VFSEDGVKVVDGAIAVDISSDEFEARVRLLHADLPGDSRLILETLHDAGVTCGILEQALLELSLSTGHSVVVAKGVRPGRGKDGWVEYLFTPLPSGDEQWNPYTHPVVRNTRAGQTIAIIHPPSEGTPGTTVTGKTIPGRLGRKASLELGSNVTRDKNDLTRVVAKVDGNIVPLPSCGLNVHPVLCIAGDLDLSVGDVDFVGSLKVEGDVKGGVSVKVGKDLYVLGGVEDATIECGGEVVVEKGFIGHGHGCISARGDVRVHHVRNQLVKSEGNVCIGIESIDARIEAGGKVEGITAVIIGGCVEAGGDIEVKTIGSVENGQVRIHGGKRGWILLRLAEIDKGCGELENLLRGLRQTVYAHGLARVCGSPSPEQETGLKELQVSVDNAHVRMSALQHERHTLTQELQHMNNPRVIVHDVIYENVSIDIDGARLVTDTPLKQVMFVKEKHRVVPRDLEWRVPDGHDGH